LYLFFRSAERAALLRAVLDRVLNAGHDLDEGRLHLGDGRSLGERRGGGLHVRGVALAAFLLVLDVTGGLAALQLALGTRAGGRLGARPRARSLLTEGSTVGLRGDAGRVALSRRADRLTLRARLLLAHVLGAADRALRLLAVDRALGAGGLLALHLALGTRADGMADGGAGRVVTLPAALRVAVLLALLTAVGLGLAVRLDLIVDLNGVSDGGEREHRQQEHSNGLFHGVLPCRACELDLSS